MIHGRPPPSSAKSFQERSEEEAGGSRNNALWLAGCTVLSITGGGAIIVLILCAGAFIFSTALTTTATPTRPALRSGLPALATLPPAPSQPSSPTATSPLPSPPSPISNLPPSPTIPPTPNPIPTPYLKVSLPGQRLESDGLALTVNDVTFEESENLSCITIDLVLENLNRDPFAYNPLDFRVIRGSESLEQTTACGNEQDRLPTGELSPGQQVQGQLSFQQNLQSQSNGFFVPLLLIYQHLDPDQQGYQLIVTNLGG